MVFVPCEFSGLSIMDEYSEDKRDDRTRCASKLILSLNNEKKYEPLVSDQRP